MVMNVKMDGRTWEQLLFILLQESNQSQALVSACPEGGLKFSQSRPCENPRPHYPDQMGEKITSTEGCLLDLFTI